jgi:outer membrane protein assembly factor BamB
MTKWSRELHAAAIPSPLYHDGSVYIGTNLGTFHCLDAETGEEKWRRQLKAEILRKASVYQDSVLVGSGDGVVTCFGLDGDKRFEISAQHAVYCPLVVEGDQLYYGNVEAELVCYNLAKNEVVWRNSEAEYSVEAQPVPTEDRVYFSAWDGYFYCLGKATGETLWKTAAPKNRERVDAGSAVSRYYGPADTPPIPLGDRVLLCDRGYEAATYDLDGNYIKPFASDVAAMNYDAGTERVVVRHIKEPAAAYSLEGEKLWTSDVTLGRLPIQPTLTSGNVLATTNDGYLHALDLATGKTNWSYRVTPQLYVLGAIETNPAGTIAFAAGMNGVVKAIDLNSIQNIYKV